jgi:uncharacterized membrane protein
MNGIFSIKEALTYGFRATWKHIKLVFFVWLIVIGLGFIFEFLAESWVGECFRIPESVTFLTYRLTWCIAARLLLYLVFVIIELGILRIALDIYDKDISQLDRMLSVVPFIIPYILATLLFKFVTFIGFILLIIPGIILSIKYNFYDLFIIDTNCGVIEAFKKSSLLTDGYKWHLFLFMLACILVCIVGIATVIGIFFVFPAVYLARVYVYRKLLLQDRLAKMDLMKYW